MLSFKREAKLMSGSRKLQNGCFSRREWLLGMASSALLLGCQTPHSIKGRQSLQRYLYYKGLMGTVFTITIYAADEASAKAASEAAFARVLALNDMMTDYDRDSELMRLCRAPAGQPVAVSKDLFFVISRAQKLAEKTGGKFDITLGPYIRLWRRARRQRELPLPEYLQAAGKVVGYQNLKLDARKQTVALLKPDMVLDLGGIAKGFAADEARKVLNARGLKHVMVAASGDLSIGEPPPGKAGWTIGIDSIDAEGGKYSQVVQVKNCGLSTSGDTEQFVEINGERYSHIVDPDTGIGLRERIGVTIITGNSTDSDSFATAVSVLGAEQGLKFIESQPKTAGLIVLIKDGKKRQIESKRFQRIPKVKV